MQTYRFKIIHFADGCVGISLIVSRPLLGENRKLHLCIGHGKGATAADAMAQMATDIAMEMAT